MVGVSAPLCRNFGFSAVAHPITVEHGDNGIVGFEAAAAGIDTYNVTISDFLCVVGEEPYLE